VRFDWHAARLWCPLFVSHNSRPEGLAMNRLFTITASQQRIVVLFVLSFAAMC
jgi:hypothetical protein